jgi:hypothetical protein
MAINRHWIVTHRTATSPAHDRLQRAEGRDSVLSVNNQPTAEVDARFYAI